MIPGFASYIGIDYSGKQTPSSSLKGLRVYEGDRLIAPHEVEPPPSPRWYWTRRGIAKWLVERLSLEVLSERLTSKKIHRKLQSEPVLNAFATPGENLSVPAFIVRRIDDKRMNWR